MITPCTCALKRFTKRFVFTLEARSNSTLNICVKDKQLLNPRGRIDQRKPRFYEPMVMIHDRSSSTDGRAIPGHWEGDLTLRAGNKSVIGTLVERSTRFTIPLHLPHRHDSEAIQEAIIHKMRNLPAVLRNSLTWDQGSEMALPSRISTALDSQVYFCNPHTPRQRGTSENTNGLLRQRFPPKSTDLNIYSEAYLDAVAEELNDRPRKTFDYDKPSERILELIS